ncbi:MAG: hypothetical protein ACFE7R_04615 [Candidatus Hodarchaeota archaeon]
MKVNGGLAKEHSNFSAQDINRELKENGGYAINTGGKPTGLLTKLGDVGQNELA